MPKKLYVGFCTSGLFFPLIQVELLLASKLLRIVGKGLSFRLGIIPVSQPSEANQPLITNETK